MLRDVFFDHRIHDGARGDREVAAHPQVATPELFPEVGELLKEHAGGDALEPLHDLTHALVGAAGDQTWSRATFPERMVSSCSIAMSRKQVADAEGHRPHEDRFPVLREPDEVDHKIIFAMRPAPVVWHATILPHPETRLKARVFHHPRGGEQLGKSAGETASQTSRMGVRPIWSRLPSTDQRTTLCAPEVLQHFSDPVDRSFFQGAEAAAKSIQHADFQLPTRRLREVVIARPHHERRQLLRLCYG